MAFTLSVIILTFITSLFLNPTVFFYNKRKKSIAGLLFRIISATDFVICLYWPAMMLYYAATLDLEKMGCDQKQIQICNSEVRSVNHITGIISITLTAVVLMATALLAIVRSIQIANPFYQLRKSWVWIVLASLIALQVGVWTFAIFSPFGSKTFKIENFIFNTTHPFGTTEKVKWINKVSSFIQFTPLFLAQSCAVVATALTTVTLLKQPAPEPPAPLTFCPKDNAPATSCPTKFCPTMSCPTDLLPHNVLPGGCSPQKKPKKTKKNQKKTKPIYQFWCSDWFFLGFFGFFLGFFGFFWFFFGIFWFFLVFFGMTFQP